jgi:beta-alanine degradation protein BauB
MIAARSVAEKRRCLPRNAGGRNVEVELKAGEARWVGAQEHTGENIGDTASRSIFVELKESAPVNAPTASVPLGPSAP